MRDRVNLDAPPLDVAMPAPVAADLALLDMGGFVAAASGDDDGNAPPLRVEASNDGAEVAGSAIDDALPAA